MSALARERRTTALARWVALVVAVGAAGIALFALNAWRQTAWLPYNAEGRREDRLGERLRELRI